MKREERNYVLVLRKLRELKGLDRKGAGILLDVSFKTFELVKSILDKGGSPRIMKKNSSDYALKRRFFYKDNGEITLTYYDKYKEKIKSGKKIRLVTRKRMPGFKRFLSDESLTKVKEKDLEIFKISDYLRKEEEKLAAEDIVNEYLEEGKDGEKLYQAIKDKAYLKKLNKNGLTPLQRSILSEDSEKLSRAKQVVGFSKMKINSLDLNGLDLVSHLIGSSYSRKEKYEFFDILKKNNKLDG